jgi:hypothetical protein
MSGLGERSIIERALDRLPFWPLSKHGHAGFGQASSRAYIVNRFHDVRREEHPPVFIIEGVPLDGKTELLGRMRETYRHRFAYLFRQVTDARLDFTPPKSAEAEAGLEILRRQLHSRDSFWRPAPTPRFDLMRAQLHAHRINVGEQEPAHRAVADFQWALDTGSAIYTSLQSGGVPLVKPSLKAGPIRWIRQFRVRAGIGPAAKWVKEYRESLPEAEALGRDDATVTRAIERALTVAMAADLARATRRKLGRLQQIAIFIDAYHRVEKSSNPFWLVQLADDLRATNAAVVLVVASRKQRHLTARMKEEPDYESHGVFDTSSGFELHRLQPLEYLERVYELAKYRVPETHEEDLANAAFGHPLALRLLGMAFGQAKGERVDYLAPRIQEALRKFPRDKSAVDWFERFCDAIAPYLFDELDSNAQWYAHAAAATRGFDRPLLAQMIGKSFRGDSFNELVETPLVEAPRPNTLLAEKEGYRMRDFARQLLHDDSAATEARLTWHRRAAEYFHELTKKSDTDPERQFALRVEELYHRSYIEVRQPEGNTDDAESRLAQALMAEQTARRFDHCELLLKCADDMYWLPDESRARRLALAGRIYLASDRYDIAEERLREALRLAEQRRLPDALLFGIRQSIVKSLHYRGRYEEARTELRALLREVGDSIPVIVFHGVWYDSLLATSPG